MEKHWETLPFLPQTLAHETRVSGAALALFDATTGENGITYAELRARIAAAAPALSPATSAASLSIETKDLIVVAPPRSVDGVVAYLASAGSGHAVAMMDPSMPHKQAVIESYAPLFVIAPPDFAGQDGAGLKGYGLCSSPSGQSPFGTLALWRRMADQNVSAVHPDLYLVLLTSGSTGNSKGVRLSYDNLRANTQSIIKSLDLAPATRALAHLPLSYSFGLSILHMQLAVGGSLVLSDDGLMTPTLWDLARRCQATLFAGVPYHYDMLLRLGLRRLQLPDLRIFLQAGGKMQPSTTKDLLAFVQSCGGELFIMYGQTEAAPRMSCFALHKFPDKLGSSGKALEGGSFAITEDDEIIYKGPNVMMGYAQTREDLAQGDVMGHRLATGDVGYLDADGFLTITGRLQRFAKLFGQRIALDDLEKIAAATVPESQHIALESPEKIVLFTTETRQDRRDAIKEALLSETKLPSTWFELRPVSDLPRKANGKTDYQKLKEFL